MRPQQDPLYRLFEHHLFNALVENETSDDLVAHVVKDYLALLLERGFIPQKQIKQIEFDLKEEVLEMYRKKTYGHPSLASFRKSQKPPTPTAATMRKRRLTNIIKARRAA